MQDDMQEFGPGLIEESAPAVLLSTAAPWRDILVVEQHRLDPRRWHQSVARPYLVGMVLSTPGQLRWRMVDRPQDRSCEPAAGRCLLALNSPVQWQQSQEADIVVAALDPAFVSRIAAPLQALTSKALKPISFNDPGIESILLALRTELLDGCPSGRLYGESLAAALAARLVWLRERPLNGNHAGGLPSARLRRVLDYIDAHLAGDTSLGRLSDLIGMSPRQFRRVFVQSTGLPPHRYILRRRIVASKDLLLSSQLSLAEISYVLGFPSQSHFTTTFKRTVGVTPAVFRKTRSSS